MAGLLDYLYSPSSYSGDGGLLGRLMPSVANIPQSQGFPQQEQAAQNPIAVGGYQMPRLGSPDQFAPQQVMTPPNATPTQGQMPQPAPSVGDRLLGGFEGFARGGGLLPALAGAARGFSDGTNQTAQYLASKGIDPALAKTIVSDPGLLRAVLPQMIGVGGQTDDIKEYTFAKQQEPGLTFKDFMNRKRAVSGEYSLTPQYGTDKDGNTVLIQTGKSGEAIQTKLPEGVKISSGVDKVDLGTSWGIIDKRNGQMIGTQPKDLAGAEKQKAVGEAQGQAQSKLPAALVDANETTKKIDQLLENKGLDSIVGPIDQFRGSVTLGDEGRSALARLEQLQGTGFLQAYNTLKGGGAITEVEGQKAERAIARMQRYQSEADFRSALMDFRDAVKTGIRKLQAAAGNDGKYPDAIANTASPTTSGSISEGATATNPQTGQKIVFKGGKWTPAQ